MTNKEIANFIWNNSNVAGSNHQYLTEDGVYNYFKNYSLKTIKRVLRINALIWQTKGYRLNDQKLITFYLEQCGEL